MRKWELESSFSQRPILTKSEKIPKVKLRTQKNLLYQAVVTFNGAIEKMKQFLSYRFNFLQGLAKYSKPVQIENIGMIPCYPLLLYLYFLFPFLPESGSKKFYDETISSKIVSPLIEKLIFLHLFYQYDLTSLDKGRINDIYFGYFDFDEEEGLDRKTTYLMKGNRKILEQTDNPYIRILIKKKDEDKRKEIFNLINQNTLIYLQDPALLLIFIIAVAGRKMIKGIKINKMNIQKGIKKEGKEEKEINYLMEHNTLIRGVKDKVNWQEVKNEEKKKYKRKKTEESKKIKEFGIIKKTQKLKLKEEDIDHKGKKNRRKYLGKIKRSTNNITNKVESKIYTKYGDLNTKGKVIEDNLYDLLHSVKLEKMKTENKRSQRGLKKSQKERINIINLHKALRRRIQISTRKRFLVAEKVGTL